MIDPMLALRSAVVLVPAILTAVAYGIRRPDPRLRAASLLSFLWCIPSLTAVDLVATRVGWWQFGGDGGDLLGIPVDLLVGWALLWGPFPLLSLPRTAALAWVVATAGWVDVLAMPRLQPLVALGPNWLFGEVIALLLVLVPAQILGRLTRDRTALPVRASLQAVCFVGFILFLLPLTITTLTHSTLALPDQAKWAHLIALQFLALFAAIGASAVQEFASRGDGTPVPFDPPVRLVSSGLYAYVRNPMQLSQLLLLMGIGIWLSNVWLVLAGVMVAVYSSTIAAWSEDLDLDVRFGEDWRRYRQEVRPWLPRWRPHIVNTARLYVAQGCAPCSVVGNWVRARNPTRLEIVAAEDHPTRDLDRITYEAATGDIESGVAAMARAFEHIHLGWTLLGVVARLPVMRPIVQLLADASGAGPRLIKRRSDQAAATCSVRG